MPGASVDGGSDQDGFPGHRDARAFQHHQQKNRTIAILPDKMLGRGAIEKIQRLVSPPERLQSIRDQALKLGRQWMTMGRIAVVPLVPDRLMAGA